MEFSGVSLDALAEGSLADCVLEWDLPLPVAVDDTVHQATLSCLLTLGRRLPGSAAARADLGLTLHFGGAVYTSGRPGCDLEAGLAQIRRQLPAGALFSDERLGLGRPV
ncbi:hypothetical protein GCM10020367_43120 [Streptomyces sannanensis]|uniref:Uncharacterized protein n=1 Tax=Streptomyces sannanensis TaxID=285536 RepID=A0ABP6SFR9_9ACTN